jgi:hypothetical protein
VSEAKKQGEAVQWVSPDNAQAFADGSRTLFQEPHQLRRIRGDVVPGSDCAMLDDNEYPSASFSMRPLKCSGHIQEQAMH